MSDVPSNLKYQHPPDVRVSIGMPVYNGESTLSGAIENVLNQSLIDIEIIISDNESTDRTAEICKEFAGRDSRIQYFRQRPRINATENFKFVLAQAKAPYFMWAAHDDTRDAKFVEKLLPALESNPNAVLAFGDVIQTVDGERRPLQLNFVNVGLSTTKRLKWAAFSQLHHLYGLWRTEALRRVNWRHANWWHDTPLMMAASLLGDFVHAPGAEFHYKVNRRWFFKRENPPNFRGLLNDLYIHVKKAVDLFVLIWISAITVGRLAGPATGALAGVLVFGKVCGQTIGFFYRRIWRTKLGNLHL